ncbi:hypothetical protein KIN20_011451 [Parelaphostrongylus tenuis]|uniref:Uncharacterized protein n=1 Tax=Parelaphostrongylus tenuis TaxID=148309 RepID=A0AAD5MAX5_PARTN|nr:hypothetical protein KIN20_011451 [Parelaphostrongylus tenuis]
MRSLLDPNELMCEDDPGNLTLSMDDSQDSCRLAAALAEYDDQQNSSDPSCNKEFPFGEAAGHIIKSVKDMIRSDAFNGTTKDKITINWEREKLTILCSKEKHHALMSARDQALLRGRVSSMDLVLMASKKFPLTGVVEARRNADSAHYGRCPAVHVCLAWLCHAAQCSISSVVPGGEVFPRAERYIHDRLEQATLPEVDENDRIELAIFQLYRVLDVLSVCDLRSLTPVDRSILIFAICRLVLDRNTCCGVQYRSSLAIENIMNASALTKHATLTEFSSIFPLISDDLVNLQLCHEIIRLSNVDPTCCLSLFSSTLIHISERAECEPSNLSEMSMEEVVDAHLGVVVDVIDNVLDLFEDNSKYKCVVMIMFDASLHPSLCSLISEMRNQQLTSMFHELKNELRKNRDTDSFLIDQLLRSLCDRYKIQFLGHPEMLAEQRLFQESV